MPLDTVHVILETIFRADLLTGAKHSDFSANHLADIDKTKHNYFEEQRKNLNNHIKTT